VCSRMTESVGNNDICQILNLPSKIHFCNTRSIKITSITKNVFKIVSNLKNPASANYESKNTRTFQFLHCQQVDHAVLKFFFFFFRFFELLFNVVGKGKYIV
jgi:hypothetical protein